jgi:hypothetical protein
MTMWLARRPPTIVLVTSGAVILYASATAWAIERTSYNIWPALIIGPAIAPLILPWIRRTAASEGDWFLYRAAPFFLVLKLTGTLLRYNLARRDATVYHQFGRTMAEAWRAGVSVSQSRGGAGTPVIRSVTAGLYYVIGPSMVGGFLVFSALGFVGLYLLYRAGCIGCPDIDRRRLALLIFVTPSLLFWPSSIGKESWMMLFIGMSALGAALALRGELRGFTALALGMAGTVIVRPHITVILFLALSSAYVIRPRSRTATGPVLKVGGLVALLAVGMGVLSLTERFFHVDVTDAAAVTQILETTEKKTTTGDATFDAPSATNPAQLPLGIVTVLFRPTLVEASNGLAVISALESTVIFFVVLRSRRRWRDVPRRVFREPFLAFCVSYVLLFCFAFANIGNFGILARQRVQVIPFLFILMARRPADERAEVSAEQQEDLASSAVLVS